MCFANARRHTKLRPWAKVSFLDGVERRSAAVLINAAWCTRSTIKVRIFICTRLTLVQAAALLALDVFVFTPENTPKHAQSFSR